MLAAMQERTQYRPTADSALMRWIVRHAAWLIPRFGGNDVQSPFFRAMGGPCRGKLVGLGETVLAHLPEVGKGSGTPAPKLADRWKIWRVASDLTDEHFARTDDGVVYARNVRRRAEHSWSEENLKSVIETQQKPRSTTTDDAADPRAVAEVHENTRTRKRTTTVVTSQTTRIMTSRRRRRRRRRRFRSPTQRRRRARAEERSAQEHKRMCS